MKKEKLYDAITNISDENINRADGYMAKIRMPSKKLWISAVAAMLTIAIVIGVVLWPGKDAMVLSANAIFEAQYPHRSDLENTPLNMDTAYYLSPFFKELIAKSLTGAGDENVVISPLSVYMALCTLAESAGGESRKQILETLGYTEGKEIWSLSGMELLQRSAKDIFKAIYNEHPSSTRLLANSVWLDKSVEFDPVTMKKIADNYYASSFSGDIGSEQMNKVVKSWLNENTKNVLSEQVKDIELDPETVYAIMSTVYFKGSWDSEFNEKRNTQGIFHSAKGDVELEYMKKSVDQYYYYGEGFAAVLLSMQGDNVMWFILPDEGVEAEKLLENSKVLEFMTPGNKTADSKFLQINMTVPKFDVEYKTDLSDVLKKMGITDVFDPLRSDMSPVLKGGALPSGYSLYATEVLHGSRVRIDEEGCEGASYTIIPADPTSPAPPDEEVDFILDRPFIFAVTSCRGLPLFTGIVNNP